MQCSIARTLEHVGSWWSLLVIREAMMGAYRFKHFERSLGIAKNTLTSRLNELVEHGIFEKGRTKDGSSYEEYRLTQKGRELAPVLMALAQWGDKWAEHEDGRTFYFADPKTGEELPRIWPRRENGEELKLGEVLLKKNEALDDPHGFLAKREGTL